MPMGIVRSFTGLIWLLAAALCGLALIFVPNWLISQYQTVRQLGSFWATLYLIAVGSGAVLLGGSASWIFWKLWGRSAAKQLRRQRRNKNPSELTVPQMDAEIDENLQSVSDLRAQRR